MQKGWAKSIKKVLLPLAVMATIGVFVLLRKPQAPQPQSPQSGVSEVDAVRMVKEMPEVKDYLKEVPNGLVDVNGEEENAYMVQVYEIKDGHTATFNWYTVDKATGEVKKKF